MKLRDQDLQAIRNSLNDKELRLFKAQAFAKDSLAKIFTYVKLQISKFKTEIDFIKR